MSRDEMVNEMVSGTMGGDMALGTILDFNTPFFPFLLHASPHL